MDLQKHFQQVGDWYMHQDSDPKTRTLYYFSRFFFQGESYCVGKTLNESGQWENGVFRVDDDAYALVFKDDKPETLNHEESTMLLVDGREIFLKYVESTLPDSMRKLANLADQVDTVDTSTEELRTHVNGYDFVVRMTGDDEITITMSLEGQEVLTEKFDASEDQISVHAITQMYKSYRFKQLSEEIPGLTVHHAGGVCPYQAEGSIHGQDFYFRYRHNIAVLRVGGIKSDWFNPLYQAESEPQDPNLFMDDDIFCDMIGDMLSNLHAPKYRYRGEIEFTKNWLPTIAVVDKRLPTIAVAGKRYPVVVFANSIEEARANAVETYLLRMREHFIDPRERSKFEDEFMDTVILHGLDEEQDHRAYPEGFLESVQESLAQRA